MRALVVGIGVVLIAALVVAWWSGGAGNSEEAVQTPRSTVEALGEGVEIEPFVAKTDASTRSVEANTRRSVEREVDANSQHSEFWVRAVDARGTPLEFAVLQVVVRGGDGLPERIVADRQGRFAWTSSAAAVGLRVTTSRLGVLLVGEVRCETARTRTAPDDVVLEPVPLLLSGRVVDARGTPIENARVQATLANERPEPPREPTEVDAERLELERALKTKVPFAEPEPVPIAREDWAEKFSATTDSRGGFHLQSGEDAGWVSVSVRAEGFRHVEQLSWPRGTSNVTIVLEGVAKLGGRLVLHPSVQSSSLSVIAEPLSDPALPVLMDRYLFQGYFSLHDLPGGTYALQLASDKFYAPSLELPIVLESELAVAGGDIRDVGEFDLSEQLLETQLTFEDARAVITVEKSGIRVRCPEKPPEAVVHEFDYASYFFTKTVSVLHGPGEWRVPLHAEEFHSTHVQLTGGQVRVELEPE